MITLSSFVPFHLSHRCQLERPVEYILVISSYLCRSPSPILIFVFSIHPWSRFWSSCRSSELILVPSVHRASDPFSVQARGLPGDSTVPGHRSVSILSEGKILFPLKRRFFLICTWSPLFLILYARQRKHALGLGELTTYIYAIFDPFKGLILAQKCVWPFTSRWPCKSFALASFITD